MKHLLPTCVRAALVIVWWFVAAACQNGSAAPAGGAGARSEAGGGGAGSAGSSLPSLCSGCSGETQDRMDMTVHLHHVHMNVADRERSAQFYQQFFKARRVRLNDVTEALHVVPTLLLLDQQASAPPSGLPTAFQHIGWGSADVGAWYTSALAAGVAPDTRGNTLFNTAETPTIGEPGSGAFVALLGNVPGCFPVPDVASYMYVLGPDRERIEVWSGVDQRVNHLHFTTPDLAATVNWYQRLLGMPLSTPLFNHALFLDDLLFFFEPIGARDDYEPTDDHVLGHLALSVTDLEAWRKRVGELKIEVVSEPALVHGFRSFFIRGPDGMLIELVQAAPFAELCPAPKTA